jgi:hypothetical protein
MSRSIYEPDPAGEPYRFRHSAIVIPKLLERTASTGLRASLRRTTTTDFCDSRSWSMLAAFFNAAALPNYSSGIQGNPSESTFRIHNDHPSIVVGM